MQGVAVGAFQLFGASMPRRSRWWRCIISLRWAMWSAICLRCSGVSTLLISSMAAVMRLLAVSCMRQLLLAQRLDRIGIHRRLGEQRHHLLAQGAAGFALGAHPVGLLLHDLLDLGALLRRGVHAIEHARHHAVEHAAARGRHGRHARPWALAPSSPPWPIMPGPPGAAWTPVAKAPARATLRPAR